MANSNNEGTKQTWTGAERQSRIEAIKNEIKTKKKLDRDDIYRFALKEFGISIRVIDEYLKELQLLGVIEITKNGDTDFRTVIAWRNAE